MMIRSVVNCVVKLGLSLKYIDINILWMWVLPDGLNQISMWRPYWRFLWHWIIEWRP